MLLHIVIFSWQDAVTDEQVHALRSAIDAMRPQIAGLRSLQHGPDLRIRGGNGDYALIAAFDDEQAWHSYQEHPAHKALVRDVIAPMRERSVAMQVAA